ncbi:MAG: 30S ribosomal protein S9 [Candidatus Buchananbacteria bacterium]|nr:30S ribosomal protein S9 [Candidatus Buchananbacteria bacterium]
MPTKIKEQEETTTKKRVRHSYIYAVGRRKTSIARVRLVKSGSGKIVVNEKSYDAYFPTFELKNTVIQPLQAVGKEKDLDFSIKVAGGGSRGQAEAIRHGVARALMVLDPDLKPALKAGGFLTRDSRRKERKKPGLLKARRAPQFSKR